MLTHDLGRFADLTALQAQHATGRAGDFARLTSTETIWNWNGIAWVDTLVDAASFVDAKITFNNTDPATILNPSTGKVYVGTYQGVIWLKDESGLVKTFLTNLDLTSQYYGIQFSTSISSPDCTRIGSGDLHALLPVHNKMYACLLNDDGTENYKLNASDWTKKLTGGDSDLTGADGQVMICIPAHYVKFEAENEIRKIKVSEYALDGFTLIPKQYVSAYEASVQRSTSKLASVKNTDTDYRGGNNDAANDANDATLLGMPATSISRTNFRTYARARGTGWEMYNYQAHKSLMYLFTIEYATLNSQKAVNTALDGSGYKQGGLGDGVTNLDDGLWNTWKAYYPFIACGASNSLASGSGEVSYDLPAGYGAVLATHINRYRGVEMPFGHLWKNCDGINVRIGADTDADPTSKVYLAADNADWNDSNYTNYELAGEIPRANGYVKEMIYNEIMPLSIGGGSTDYWCDYFYTSLPASGESLRTVLFGGKAYNGTYTGFGFSSSDRAPSYTTAYIGSRLCFIPA